MLKGPLTDEEKPILIDKGHELPIPRSPGAAGAIAWIDVARLMVSDSGTIVVAGPGSTYVAQLKDNLAIDWYSTALPTGIVAMALDPEGHVTFSGGTTTPLPGETQVGGTDAFVGKLDAAGGVDWAHQWGSNGGQSAKFMSVAADGSIVVGGLCGGQAPGNPPDNAGGQFVAKYEPGGARLWLRQYPGVGRDDIYYKIGETQTTSVFAASDDSVYVGLAYSPSTTTAVLRKLDPGGQLLLDTPLWAGAKSLERIWPAPQPAFDRQRGSIYGFTDFTTSLTPGPALLARVALSGDVEWLAQPEQRSAVIEPVEQVTWNGTFSFESIAVTTDSFYVSGKYRNWYMNGSQPHPEWDAAFVGRYDLAAQRIWFHEFQIDDGKSPTSAPHSSTIAVDMQGNVIVALVVNTSGGNPFVFRLDKADGAIK